MCSDGLLFFNLTNYTMSNYGNVLVFKDLSDDQGIQIELALNASAKLFQRFDDTYFVMTTSKVKTKALADELTTLNIPFIFFHNAIADGSYVRNNQVSPEMLEVVEEILLP
jgi:hypothetical protein